MCSPCRLRQWRQFLWCSEMTQTSIAIRLSNSFAFHHQYTVYCQHVQCCLIVRSIDPIKLYGSFSLMYSTLYSTQERNERCASGSVELTWAERCARSKLRFGYRWLQGPSRSSSCAHIVWLPLINCTCPRLNFVPFPRHGAEKEVETTPP